VGGLGHYGILFAKALGADKIVGISRKKDKKSDALSLGADGYIATDDDEGWVERHRRSLDLIICTASSEHMPLSDYLALLNVDGTFIQVGAPDAGHLPPVNAFTLIANRIKIGGSAIGSPKEIAEMLQLAADRGVKPWIELIPMQDANEAVKRMTAGQARYRYVLYN